MHTLLSQGTNDITSLSWSVPSASHLFLSSPLGSFSPRLPTTAKSKSGRILELPFPAFPRSLARSSAFPSLLRRTACSSPALCPRFSSTPCRPIARWRSKPTWRRSTSSSAASAADLSSRRTVEPRGCCEIDVILQAAWRDDAFVTLVDNSNRILNLRLDASAGKTCIQIIPCSITSSSDKNDYCPVPLEGEEKQRVLDKINEYSQKIQS